MSRTILVFIETDETGEILPVSLETLTTGYRIANQTGQALAGVLLGPSAAAAAQQVQSYLAGDIYVVDHELLAGGHPEFSARALAAVIEQADSELVLLPHTLTTIDLAARTAVDLGLGLVMDCVQVEFEENQPLFVKPVFSSNVMAAYGFSDGGGMVTMRVRSAEPAEPLSSDGGQVQPVTVDLQAAPGNLELIERVQEDDDSVNLAGAEVVVAGGRGLGGPEGFALLEEVAAALNGVVGASRPPCDLEWVSPKRQVGLTGEIVSPALYLAVGISGSFQHLAGITDSKVIVAINRDEKAYIFKVADYGVVADYEEALPAFLEGVRSK